MDIAKRVVYCKKIWDAKAYVSDGISEGLLSVSQLDAKLGAITIFKDASYKSNIIDDTNHIGKKTKNLQGAYTLFLSEVQEHETRFERQTSCVYTQVKYSLYPTPSYMEMTTIWW